MLWRELCVRSAIDLFSALLSHRLSSCIAAVVSCLVRLFFPHRKSRPFLLGRSGAAGYAARSFWPKKALPLVRLRKASFVRLTPLFFSLCAPALTHSLLPAQNSPQLQYTPPQSPYTASPRGVWAEPGSNATPAPTAATTTAASTNSTDQQRWAAAAGAGGATTPSSVGQSASASSPAPSAVAKVGAVGSPGSVAGAVAVSAAAAASAAASAASAAAAAGVGDAARATPAAGAGAGVAAGAAGTAGTGAVNDKLMLLKKEKRVLHIMLKNFEKDFKEKNGREVRGRGKRGAVLCGAVRRTRGREERSVGGSGICFWALWELGRK